MLHRIAHALKRSRRGIIGMALAIAFVASLAAPVLADTTTGNISGTVTAAGKPLSNVSVVATAPSGTYSSKTDAAGFYSIIGVQPDTYAITYTLGGYGPVTQAGITVNPTITTTVNATLSSQLKTIGSTTSRSSGVSAFQPQQSTDTYSVNSNQIQTILGKSHAISESQLIISLPGASLDSSGYPVLRGGRENDEGFQYEGIDYTDAFTHQFVNSLELNGVGNFQLSPGAGDASVGNVGTGQINATVKRGTYPAFGSVEGDMLGPIYDHFFNGEYGFATPNGSISSYTTFNGDQQVRGCGPVHTNCNLVGAQLLTNYVTGRDLIENAVFKFGAGKRQSLQLFYENEIVGFYANTMFQNPNTVGYRTSAPDYLKYSASQIFGSVSPAAIAAFAAITPFEKGQTSLNQLLGRPAAGDQQPNATIKLQYSNNINDTTFMTIKAYKVNSTVYFDEPYAAQACQGVASGALCDFQTLQGGVRTGLAADFTKQIGTKHLLGFGAKYEFLHPIDTFQSASLGAIAITFDNAFELGDFLAGTTGTGVPLPAGARVPDYNQGPQANRHDTGYYVSDQFQASDKLKITAGLRLDQSAFDYPTNPSFGAFNDPNGYSSSLFLPVSTGLYPVGSPLAGTPDPALDVYAPNLYRTSSTLEPRFGFAYQFNPRNSITFSYGRSVELAPIADIDNRIPRADYAGFAAIPSDFNACGPTGDRTCRNFADQLYWENQNVIAGIPITPLQPSTFNNYDASLQHDFGNGLTAKLTPFYRRGYNVAVLFQTPLVINGVQQFDANGNPLTNAPQSSNLGTSYTTGAEFYVTKTATYGLSGTLSVTYINEFSNVIPLSGNEDFFPQIPFVSLAQGNLYRVGFVSPLNGVLALQYKWRNGFRVNPIIGFNDGYPIGTGLVTAFAYHGQNFNLPSTNVTNPNGSTSATQYVDPANPGTIFRPNIDASRGTPEKNSPGGVLSAPRVNIANLDLEYNKPGTRNTFGLLVTNVFDQIYGQPSFNGRYQPVATGIGGPASGTTSGTVAFPGLGYVNYAGFRGNNQPYLLTPNATPLGLRFYYQLSL